MNSRQERRKGSYKRGHTRKKAKYRRPKGTRAAARRAALEVLNTRIGGLAGIEKKFFDQGVANQTTFASTDLSATGLCVNPSGTSCLNNPAQGDGPSNRDGRQIAMQSLYVAGIINSISDPNAGSTEVPVTPACSIFIVLDTQNNGSASPPTADNIWTNPSGSVATCSAPLRNLDNEQRFRVLKRIDFSSADFVSPSIAVPTTTADAGSPLFAAAGAYAKFSCYLKLGGMMVNYLSGTTTAVQSAIADNAIHIYCLRSDSTEGDSNAQGMDISYNARLRFTG